MDELDSDDLYIAAFNAVMHSKMTNNPLEAIDHLGNALAYTLIAHNKEGMEVDEGLIPDPRMYSN